MNATAGGHAEFQPLRDRARSTQAALLVVLLLDLAAFAVGLSERSLLQRIRDGEAVTPSELDASDTRVALFAVLQTLAYVATVVLFLLWFHRAYRNLPVVGAHELRYRTSAALWAWFVPFLNLFRPKQIANDIWRGSDPDAPPARGIEWRQRPLPWFYLPWWAFWLVSQLVYNYAFRVSLIDPIVTEPGDVIDRELEVNQAYLFADALSAAAAILATIVVHRVTRREHTAATRRSSTA
jgi:hypothetical protein